VKARALTTAAWTATSVLAAHAVAYRITYTDPHARAHALTGSGHGWTGLLPVLLAAALLGGLLGAAVTAVRARRGQSLCRDLATLVLGGSASYTAIEVLERLIHHGSIDGLLHDLAGGGLTTLLVGLTFIVLTAPLLLLARRAVERLAAGTDTLPAARRRALLPTGRVTIVSAPFHGFEPTRGPPLARLG